MVGIRSCNVIHVEPNSGAIHAASLAVNFLRRTSDNCIVVVPVYRIQIALLDRTSTRLFVRLRRQRNRPRHLLRRRGDRALFPPTVPIRHSTKTDEYSGWFSTLLWFCHTASADMLHASNCSIFHGNFDINVSRCVSWL